VLLRDHNGKPLPAQYTPLARWSDGSSKWVLLDCLSSATPEGACRWQLEAGPDPEDRGAWPPMQIQGPPEPFLVTTGNQAFRVGPSPTSFLQVHHPGPVSKLRGQARLVLTNADGKEMVGQIEGVHGERTGPVRTTVRLEGTFPNLAPCRFCAWLSFFAGTGLVQVCLTLHNPRRAKHAGGLWDLGDPGSLLFRDLTLEVALEEADPALFWCAEPGQPWQATAGPVEIYQDSSGGANWRSPNHVNRHGEVPCAFQGYRVRTREEQRTGLRANPLLSLRGQTTTLTAALPNFWQQFPKAIEAENHTLRVRLFPGQCADLFELQGGEQKTHTVWLSFDGPEQATETALDWVHQPPLIRAAPEWYAACGVLPSLLPPRTEPPDRLDRFLTDAVAGPRSFLAQRERVDEYGWRHFGEVYADHEDEFYQGPSPAISHYNNQYDLVQGTLVQYYRTGDRRWLELHEPLARHVIDIDIYHTTLDRAAYNGGLFWFTDHYKSAATCTHRTYSRANQPPGKVPYGGGPGSSHCFSTGLLLHYYRTGDPSARAAVLSLADWVQAMDEGSRNILGVLDEGPTGLASCTTTDDYHGPGRGPGLSIHALLDGWQVSGNRRYLGKVEELIRRCIHPTDDVPAHDLLNVELRWSYTVFLSALARYLEVKAEADELDCSYAYARASLLHYARWMLEHEEPYYDHPEKLEYHTEAWAGQELRKANVFRLAAAHAGEPLRARLLEKGENFAARAWTDLLRFERRNSARGIALVLAEGTRDLWFRRQPPPSFPPPRGEFEFAQPEPFLGQKARVRRQLKSIRGLARALLRFIHPKTWEILLSQLGKPFRQKG
jgi:hypothetical protein